MSHYSQIGIETDPAVTENKAKHYLQRSCVCEKPCTNASIQKYHAQLFI